jgi:hypothetical protein
LNQPSSEFFGGVFQASEQLMGCFFAFFKPKANFIVSKIWGFVKHSYFNSLKSILIFMKSLRSPHFTEALMKGGIYKILTPLLDSDMDSLRG